MNLEKLTVCDAVEEKEELRKVTVTLAFEMKDGKCTDESLQPLYDYLAPGAVVEEDEELATDWSN